jgi:purine-binding chemotaxis protein CheW
MFGFRQFSEEELAILKTRAERVARATKDDSGDEVFGALMITLRGENYAIPIETLTGVYESISVVPVPCTPPYVSGIANIRGHIVPVLDLAHLLNVSGEAEQDANMLVVASENDVTMAFRAEMVGDVMNIFSAEVNLPPSNGSGQQMNYIQGILSDGAALLNIRAILTDPALSVSELAG